MFLTFLRIFLKLLYFGVVSLRFWISYIWRITDKVRSYVSFCVSFCFVTFLTVMLFFLLEHRQPKLNIREPLNYKDLYGNTTDLCKMVETNIILSIKST